MLTFFSPNTPGLRSLQSRTDLTNLIKAVLHERNRIQTSHRKTPLLLKIAPDLSSNELEDIADVVLNNPEVCSQILFLD